MVSQAEIKGMMRAVKEYITDELKPLRQRLAVLENHSESAANQADNLTKELQSLEFKLNALSANNRRGIQ